MADEPRRHAHPNRAVVQVAMTKAQKKRCTRIAGEHGIRLSQTVRQALDLCIKQMGWE